MEYLRSHVLLCKMSMRMEKLHWHVRPKDSTYVTITLFEKKMQCDGSKDEEEEEEEEEEEARVGKRRAEITKRSASQGNHQV
ncbi:hypothetical protein AK812_SmicGene42053 [Symbiodinium microadriaticum]|uniref:Uncharacterized protein n=1 Tax=Symbiodinium microadriaticum TaxID=2951 RepID=A0A1Q9C4I5_SYMMI|nr:hypothetical protein AK812_SmicGene42053 [Symbiodinium microadriaticum]